MNDEDMPQVQRPLVVLTPTDQGLLMDALVHVERCRVELCNVSDARAKRSYNELAVAAAELRDVLNVPQNDTPLPPTRAAEATRTVEPSVVPWDASTMDNHR